MIGISCNQPPKLQGFNCHLQEVVTYNSQTIHSLFRKDVPIHLLFGRSYKFYMHSSRLPLKVHFFNYNLINLNFFRKVNEKWKDWLYFSCFIVVNHFTTVFCGQTGVQGYPMLLFLETDFQVTKKGEDQKLWRNDRNVKYCYMGGGDDLTHQQFVWICFVEYLIPVHSKTVL